MDANEIMGMKVCTEKYYEFDPEYFAAGRMFVARQFDIDGTLYFEGLAIIVMTVDKQRVLYFDFYRKFSDGVVCADVEKITINSEEVANGTWQFTPTNIFTNEPNLESVIKELQAKLLRYDYMLDELGPAEARAESAEREVKSLIDRLGNTQCKRGDFIEKLCDVLGIDKMPPFWDEAEEVVLKTIKDLKGEE